MAKLIFLISCLVVVGSTANAQDSLRMETVDGKKFIIHQVDEKETLYSLSKRYGASIEDIIEYNAGADAGLEVGQILRIPYLKRKPTMQTGNAHVVQVGETLYSISRLYQVTVDELKAWNSLTDNALNVGQELIIREQNGAESAVTTVPAEKGYHRVAAGETLFSISRTYQVMVDDLKAWNGLTGSELSVGQLLKVSNQPVVTTPPVVPTSAPNATQSNSQDTDTPALVRDSVIRISEDVAGFSEMKEAGLAELIEGTEASRKYLALHRTAPTGTILKVKNQLNNREVFVRVVGPLPDTGVNDNLIIKISKSAFNRLGAIDSRFRVEVSYYR